MDQNTRSLTDEQWVVYNQLADDLATLYQKKEKRPSTEWGYLFMASQILPEWALEEAKRLARHYIGLEDNECVV